MPTLQLTVEDRAMLAQLDRAFTDTVSMRTYRALVNSAEFFREENTRLHLEQKRSQKDVVGLFRLVILLLVVAVWGWLR